MRSKVAEMSNQIKVDIIGNYNLESEIKSR